MKKYHKKRFSAKHIVIACALSALTASPLIYVYAFNGNLFGWRKTHNSSSNNLMHNADNIDYDPATKEQQDAGNTIKSSGSGDIPPTPTVIPGSDKKNVQLTITSANQNESNLQIRALISAVENDGVCTLTLSSAGETTVSKTAGIQAMATVSTCKGFDIPVPELAVGKWHILVEYSSETLTGSSAQDVIIK